MRIRKVSPADLGKASKVAGIIRNARLPSLRNPKHTFYFHEIRETVWPVVRYYHLLIPYGILLAAIVVIGNGTTSTLSPSESIGRVLNLVNACVLLSLINLWHMHMKANKIPIFR